MPTEDKELTDDHRDLDEEPGGKINCRVLWVCGNRAPWQNLGLTAFLLGLRLVLATGDKKMWVCGPNRPGAGPPASEQATG